MRMLLNKEKRAKRGDEQGRSWERSMGGKGAHLGDLGWLAGRGSSRGRAGQRRQVGEEQVTNLEEQGRSRTGGRRSRTGGGRLGDEQGRRLEE